MSVHHGLPHLFQFGDVTDELPVDIHLERGLEPDYDDPELYGEEEDADLEND